MRNIRFFIVCLFTALFFGICNTLVFADSGSDVIILDYVNYANGIVNSNNSATITNTTTDSRFAVKIVPNPKSTTADYISIDGYSYQKAKIDLSEYCWVAYEYFYASKNPVNANPEADMLVGRVDIPPLKTRIYGTTNIPLKANKWDIILFDFTEAKENINPESENPYLIQMHFRPFGKKDISTLSSDDTFYVSKIMFFKEKPNLTYKTGFLDGYDDGTFKGGKPLTRAEACKLIASCIEIDDEKITGTASFEDVDKDAWYARYIGYLETRNLLPFTGKMLYPDSSISYTEFAKLVLNSGIAADLGNVNINNTLGTGFGQQVDTKITRLDAAMAINQLQGVLAHKENIPNDIDMLYLDVKEDNANFAEIAEASFDHVIMDGKWLYSSEDPVRRIISKVGEEAIYDFASGDEIVAYYDKVEKQRIVEIRNTPNMELQNNKVIYVSQSTGSDTNNGLNEYSPVKTIAKANSLVKSGWTVALKRGDLWRERIATVAGVTYTAYGYGDKPKIYGSPENGANSDKWTLVYENKETGALIWKYSREDFLDVGTLVFNDGEGFAMKEVPSCVGSKYYVRGQENLPENERTPFDYTVELDKNLEFFHQANSITKTTAGIGEYIDIAVATGPLYLRCDNGNPGKVFNSIEFNTRPSAISATDNVTIDNLCIMYVGVHGISSGTVKNLTVTNCEIGWIGGSIQGYTANGNTKRSATRLGNGVEVYGGCDGYLIDNCYVYQCYDAGVTHQYSDLSSGNCKMLNVTYSNNVITDCVYSIEYFLGTDPDGKHERYGDNILFEGNLMRRAGYGFGSFRPDGHNQRHIRSSSRDNPFTNYRIINNVFDRSVQDLIYANTPYPECTPVMSGNVYIQGVDNEFYHIGLKTATSDYKAPKRIINEIGDATGKMYFVRHIPYYVYDYTPSKTYPVTDSDRN